MLIYLLSNDLSCHMYHNPSYSSKFKVRKYHMSTSSPSFCEYLKHNMIGWFENVIGWSTNDAKRYKIV